jgi:TetR/AcrR family transcriptional regulator
MRSVLLWARERPLYHLIERDKARGLIKPTVEASLLIEMILTIGRQLMKEHYETASSDEHLIAKMHRVMQILKEGVTHVHH